MRIMWRSLTASVALAVASAVIAAPAANATPVTPRAVDASAAAGVSAAPAASAASAVATAAASDDTDDTTGAAQAAGINEPGDAYMGWSAQDAGVTPHATRAQRGATGTAIDAPGQGLQALPPLKGIEGIDISHHNGYIDWGHLAGQGRTFAYIKATEGTHFIDSLFRDNYPDSFFAGVTRGAYHFATPNESSGAAQAEYFAAHGGAWSADGKTLPGALDIESNPYGAKCYGLSKAQMVGWIKSFTERYHQLTGRNAVIYTSPSWWVTCTGNTAMFASTNPLWIAHWGTNSPRIPTGWSRYAFWQYTSSMVYSINNGKVRGIDASIFNGNASDLQDLALGKWEGVSSPGTGAVLDITPESLPTATPGAAYSAALKGSGGVGKYEFREEIGKLPAGLQLSKGGKISGISTQVGHESTVTIGVRDDNGGAGSRTYPIYTTFTDMPEDQLFFGPVKWLGSHDITFGYDDGTFRPAANVNRGSMAAFLFRSVNPGIPAPKCTSMPFPDVAVGSLFCGHIAWLAHQKITKPGDGKYHASDNVTRGSMTAFLYRLTHPGKVSPKCTSKPFTDVSTDNVFCGYIQWAAANGIAKGYGDGSTYGPENAVTRGAMAAFLSRIDSLR